MSGKAIGDDKPKGERRSKYGDIRIARCLNLTMSHPSDELFTDEGVGGEELVSAKFSGRDLKLNGFWPIDENLEGKSVPDFSSIQEADKWLRDEMAESRLPMGDYAIIRFVRAIRFEEVRSIKMTDLD